MDSWVVVGLMRATLCHMPLPPCLPDFFFLPTTTNRPTRHRTERLAEALREERRNEGAFQPLPFHYVEIVHLLLQGSVAPLCVHMCVCVPVPVCVWSVWSARGLSFLPS